MSIVTTNPQHAITKARVSIQIDHAFFAFILCKHTIHITDQVDTLAVDPRKNLYINPEFISGLISQQLVWALCHEVMHPILGHFARIGTRNAYKWNYAGDAVINDMLADCGIGAPIPNTVNMPGSRHKTTEQIYNELPDKPQPKRGQPGQPSKPSNSGQPGQPGTPGQPSPDDQYDNGLGNDIMHGAPLTPAEIQEIETQIKIDVTQAALAAKVRGQLTGKLAQFVADMIEVSTPWYDILERFMQGQMRHEQSWMRPNRRFLEYGYLPSSGKTPQMGEVVIQIDVSGSITRKEMQHYAGHMQRIVDQCRPEKVHVLYVDTQVKRHDTFELGEELEFNFFSAGGTDMPAGFRYCEDHGIEPDVLICLTDGYTPWGEDPGYPVVWCISSTKTPDFGLHVPFKIEE
jgi:hypothetical protein